MTYQRVPRDRLRASAKYRDWAPEEDQQLREFYERSYAGDLTPQTELAKRLGRPIGGVRSRADKLGVSRKREIKGGFVTTPTWKSEELEILREWYPKVPIDEVIKRLPGRAKKAIFTKAHTLALHAPGRGPWTQDEKVALGIAYRRGISIHDAAAAIGKRAITVSKYATNHGYDFGRRPLLSEPLKLEQLLALAGPSLPTPAFRNPRAHEPAKSKRRKPTVDPVKRNLLGKQRMAGRRRQRREAKKLHERSALQAERVRARLGQERNRDVQRQQARRADATTRANHHRAIATRQAARVKAQAMIEAGELSAPRTSSLALKAAHRDLLADRERKQRESCPIERAKRALQRRGRVVHSMAVWGGRQDRFFVSGLGNDVTAEQLLAVADRIAA